MSTLPSIAEMKTSAGRPLPLGCSHPSDGVNYAVYASLADEVILHLFRPGGQRPLASFSLKDEQHRTGNVWHIQLDNPPLPHSYSFEIVREGERLTEIIDPHAKELEVPKVWNGPVPYSIRGVLSAPSTFDWEGVEPPHLRMEDLIIYETHVRGFTQDPSSGVASPGTYLGLIEKIPHLKVLGINCVELLPVYEFNEQEYTRLNPATKAPLCQYWGYSPLSFFAPMRRYADASSALSPADQFRTMVRELHRNGIEVILDVVYNHTGEKPDLAPPSSLAAWAPEAYYMFDAQGKHCNYTGCGNTLSCNHPVTAELIRDSLRYWVSEMHVDGFRFDLASILTRDMDGTPLDKAPLVQALTLDPILSDTKLIAEPWDAVGLYQVGSFFSHTPRWSEWNGKFRDCIRRFIKGNTGQAGEFARRLSGSQDLYDDGRTPAHGINFVTAHDGFSLRDLVSYNEKHNIANGEENRDGSTFNDSWNCGAEGATNDPAVLRLRDQQMRNLYLAQILSIGVPMLRMGDEYGHSQQGNNNTWCQDNRLSWFQWKELEENKTFLRFVSGLIQFRNSTPVLRRSKFLSPDDIKWHGTQPYHPDWSANSRLVAYSLMDHTSGHDLYVAFNARPEGCDLILPSCTGGKAWHRIVDTGLEAPFDFTDAEGTRITVESNHYFLHPFTALLLQAR